MQDFIGTVTGRCGQGEATQRNRPYQWKKVRIGVRNHSIIQSLIFAVLVLAGTRNPPLKVG